MEPNVFNSTVLVAYATKNGSTAEIAEAIAAVLREEGLDVVCREVTQVPGLERFGAVVLGSAVYMKRWRPEARRFLRRHRSELSTKPLWIFSSGPVGGAAADPSWTIPKRVVKLAESIGAHPHVVFAGRLPSAPRNFVERAMVRNTPPELRDSRDWDEIRAWARAIASAPEHGQRSDPARSA
jgi:menaquinone-dependent protoporphyrinogen oxidase